MCRQDRLVAAPLAGADVADQVDESQSFFGGRGCREVFREDAAGLRIGPVVAAGTRRDEATGQVDYINTSIGVATASLFMIEASMHVPPGYATSPDRFPVLYMPDGGMAEDFPHVVGAVDVSIKNGIIRPLLVVGIGCLQTLLERGNKKDWFESTEIVTLAGVGAVPLALSLARTLRTLAAPFAPLTGPALSALAASTARSASLSTA
mgnify:CR=1 FL=1